MAATDDYYRRQNMDNTKPSSSFLDYHYQDTNVQVSASKVAAVLTLFPVGGTLLFLSGLILAAAVVGIALATPLFVVFSPVLVPAALATALTVAGFLASGVFGVAALSTFAWMAQYLRRKSGRLLHTRV